MPKTSFALILASTAAIAVIIATGTKTHAQATGTTGVGVRPMTVPPARTPRAKAPHRLLGVASIIEADVIDARHTFDSSLGPRTEVTLDNIVVHAGNAPAERVISQLGGPMPDGHFLIIPELPVLHPGSRYILFLAATKNFYTPIWAGLAFRVETIGEKRIVLGRQGYPVSGFSIKGAKLGTTQIVNPEAQKDPLQPLSRAASFDTTLPDIANAMDAKSFGQAAMEAARTVGAPLGTASLHVVPRTQWNVQPTTAGTTP